MRKTGKALKTTRVKLLDVYRTKGSLEMLYALLKEREKCVNISHQKMPTMEQHRQFVKSRPYRAWYLIADLNSKNSVAGAIYLSKASEIGVFIFRKYRGRGYGPEAVQLLMERFKGIKRFLANVNPSNKPSIRFFENFGFGHIQNTYEWRRV